MLTATIKNDMLSERLLQEKTATVGTATVGTVEVAKSATVEATVSAIAIKDPKAPKEPTPPVFDAAADIDIADGGYEASISARFAIAPVSADKIAIDIPIIIKPPIQACTGKCYSVNMNISPSNSSWTGSWGSWKVSHGSPSVSPNNFWMWSRSGYGEGLNLSASFVNGNNYCIEATMLYTDDNMNSPYTATSNIVLTGSSVNGTLVPGGGGPVPANPFTSYVLLSQLYSSIPNNYTQTHILNFTSNNNYSNVWFYPRNTHSDKTATMTIKRVVICDKYVDPCNYSIKIYHKINCNMVNFYPGVVLSNYSALTIQGYVWDFGDGNFSNAAYPSHFYSNPGSYIVTLSVYVLNADGKCCVKRYRMYVTVQGCDPCKTLGLLNIDIAQMGSIVKYEPTLPHNNYYIYKWTFPDSTTYSTRIVYKTYIQSWASLTIYYAGKGDCCNRTIVRKIFYRPIDFVVALHSKADIIVTAEADIEPIVNKIANEEAKDGIRGDDTPIVEIKIEEDTD